MKGVDPRLAEGLKLVNDFRAQNGRAPLCLEQRMVNAAMLHSQDMARRRVMSHIGSDGSSPVDRIRRTGFPMSIGGAENVVHGSLAPGSTLDFVRMTGPMSMWVNSVPHRENLLTNAQFLGIGVANGGCSFGSDQCAYWTLNFASSAQPVQCLTV
ncbi:hypothetical protein BCR44DRAFT_49694 [Catenaria anguillulae PL171]|uniref:SCP domain-containing protein n=1 Tax=Catenaria anguillulae PL171 TaxID=765915 RepID=A0A1Y2HA79_9FUNG|nr:hypothetical protein BCR44DRAFT_49694 [Catenaria anguillulae PL171]